MRQLHCRSWLKNIIAGLICGVYSLILPQMAGQSNAQETGPLTQPLGSLRAQSWRIPVAADEGGEPIRLDVITFQPAGRGPFPLVVINHGAALDAPTRGAWDYRPDAAIKWFVAKGYAVAVLIRRGYGRSEGQRVELGNCSSPRYIEGGNEIARDIVGAVDYLREQSFVLADHIVLVGHSLGGAGSLAAASKHPHGVRGVIAFAPGAGRVRPGEICRVDLLEDAFRAFGSASDLPTLWIYAENDSYFAPDLARRLFRAFASAEDVSQELHILPTLMATASFFAMRVRVFGAPLPTAS